MQDEHGSDEEPAAVREARACLPPALFKRAYNAWRLLGRSNDFHQVVGYYRRLHDLEETFTPEARAASREAEEQLDHEPPPLSDCLHRMFPSLYPSLQAAPAAPESPPPAAPAAPAAAALPPPAAPESPPPAAPAAPAAAALPPPAAPPIAEGDAATHPAVLRYALHRNLTIQALLVEFRTFAARERLLPTFYNLLMYVSQGYIGCASGSSGSEPAADGPKENPDSPRRSTSTPSTPRRVSREPDEPVPGPSWKVTPTKSDSPRNKLPPADFAPRFPEGSPPVYVSRDTPAASSSTCDWVPVDMATLVDPSAPPDRSHPPLPGQCWDQRATDAAAADVGGPYPQYPSPASTLADLHWHVQRQRRVAENGNPRCWPVSRSTGTPDLFKKTSPELCRPYARPGYYRGPISRGAGAGPPRPTPDPGNPENARYYTGAPLRSNLTIPPVRVPAFNVPVHRFPVMVAPPYFAPASPQYGFHSSLTPRRAARPPTPRRSHETSWSSDSSGCPATPPRHTPCGTLGQFSSTPIWQRLPAESVRGGRRGRAKVKLWRERDPSTGRAEIPQGSVTEDAATSTRSRRAGAGPERRPKPPSPATSPATSPDTTTDTSPDTAADDELSPNRDN